MRVIVAWLVVLGACAGATGEPMDPDTVLGRLVVTYRGGAVADRVRMTVSTPGGGGGNEELIVRTLPGSSGQLRAVRIELGEVTLSGADGRVRATHTAHPNRIVDRAAAALTPAALFEGVPPVPAPQVWLAAGQREIRLPGSGTPTWQRTQELVVGERVYHKLIGRNASGPVEVACDGLTGRLVAASYHVPSAQGTVKVMLTFRNVEPGDPRGWALEVGSRETVQGLQELGRPRAMPEPAPKPGPEVDANTGVDPE